jgi:uncharacterized protein YabE (DUF348 family)
MRRWGKSIAAIAVFAGIFAYNLSHNKQAPSQTNSIAPKSSKQIVQDKAQQHPDTDIPTKKVELKQVIETQAIPFQTLSQNDPEITKGKTKKVVDGVAGEKKVTYRVTYVDGTETGRVKLFETVKKQPVAQVVKVGTQDLSENNHQGPAGATALCADGSLSYASRHIGACSHHGGVSIWYH